MRLSASTLIFGMALFYVVSYDKSHDFHVSHVQTKSDTLKERDREVARRRGVSVTKSGKCVSYSQNQKRFFILQLCNYGSIRPLKRDFFIATDSTCSHRAYYVYMDYDAAFLLRTKGHFRERKNNV